MQGENGPKDIFQNNITEWFHMRFRPSVANIQIKAIFKSFEFELSL